MLINSMITNEREREREREEETLWDINAPGLALGHLAWGWLGKFWSRAAFWEERAAAGMTSFLCSSFLPSKSP